MSPAGLVASSSLLVLVAACSGGESSPGADASVEVFDAAPGVADASDPGDPDAAPTESCTGSWCLQIEGPKYADELSVSPSGTPSAVSWGVFRRRSTGEWDRTELKWDDGFDPFVVYTKLHTVFAVSGAETWVAGEKGYVGHYRQSLSSWTEYRPSAPDVRGIWGAATNDVWFLHGSSLRHHWNGSEFVSMSDSDVFYNGAWGDAADNVWGFGDIEVDGGFYRAAMDHWDGDDWDMTTLDGVSGTVIDMFQDGEDMWVLVYLSFDTYVYRKNGDSWDEIATLTGYDIHDIWGRSADDIWAVGDEGVAFHWNGSTWSLTQTGTSKDLRGVSGNDDVVWAVGDDTALRWVE